MANRPNRRSAGNAIRGPQSALTDFLASHNISAHQISQDYQRRQEEAERQQALQNAAAQEAEAQSDEDEDPVERRKRKRKEEMAIMKIKQSKEFKRRKHETQRRGADTEDDDTLARRMLQKNKPLAGQLENCESCDKRFTVTPYSKTGPEGGLLCGKCSKVVNDEEKKAKAQEKKKKLAPKLRKRQTESDRMNGDVQPGSKSLVDQCVKRVSDVVNDIEEFGDLPPDLLNRLSQILSKRRVITPRTLELLLQPGVDRIAIYDCGKLETEDYQRIFAFMPDLEIVNLRFAGQLKDEPFYYMIEKTRKLRELQLGATNLIPNEAWIKLFQERGSQLESLKLSELNDSLNDDAIAELGRNCKRLKRLKLRSCLHVGEASLKWISQLRQLEFLSLSVAREASPATLVNLITTLGPNLKTLSLEDYSEADDSVLDAIRDHCGQLTKLRFTGNSLCTDTAFARVFGPDSKVPPLSFVDLSSNRDIDHVNPEGTEGENIGFGSAGLRALMDHSGPVLAHLDLHSCRHISHHALTAVFDGLHSYQFLRDIDLSFVTRVDDVIVQGVFQTCPQLQKLALFACFNARGAMIPPSIAVVGLPNAGDNIYINEDALMGM